MPLLTSLLTIGAETLTENALGTLGTIGLVLLTAGLKARNTALGVVGAAILALLLA
ncbi:hypothetical protein [Streptomyces sp. NPDC059651]|uniref:hypothetical protein n=1 Tax=unclassified Streptomyces TaxID=2593676 RepID=UPI000B19DCD6